MWRVVASYLRPLWKHWIVLASGVGALVLSALSAHFKAPLPYWTFWPMALVCFFITSFRAWRDAQTAFQSARAEVDRLRTPKYAAEQLQLVRDLYQKQDKDTRALLREIRVRGFMLESQATNFYRERGIVVAGTLHALEYNTNLICKIFGEQYRINPEIQAAIEKVFDEAASDR